MNGAGCILSLDGGEVVAVPAVHFRAAFADRVNRLAFQTATRPRAIAVELPPSSVRDVVSWLRDLGAGQGRSIALPAMLGLVQPVAAGARHPLVCLSASDSIIEAIRCGLELGIPVHGIDLPTAPRETPPARMLEDPLLAGDDFDDWIRRNAERATFARDEATDGPRERAMASRLRSLVREHGRVLFSGGLAHWFALRGHLSNPELPVTEELPDESPPGRRVLLHPAVALSAMEVLPRLTVLYECDRAPADQPRSGSLFPRGPVDIFGDVLHAAYSEFFRAPGRGPDIGPDAAALAHFEGMLGSLGILEQRVIPDVGECLLVADSLMSAAFCSVLGRHLMDCEWVRPDEWPDLPIFAPVPPLADEAGGPDTRDRAELFVPDEGPGGTRTWKREGPLRFHFAHGGGGTVGLPDPWALRHFQAREEFSPAPPPTDINMCSPRVWPPCDFRLSMLRVRAARATVTDGVRRNPEVFSGGLGGGLDVKTTVRSRARGSDRVYVRCLPPRFHAGLPLGEEGEPTVFVFDRSEDPHADWYVFGGSIERNHGPLVRDRERLREVVRSRGETLVQGLAYSVCEPVPARLTPHVVGVNLLKGVVSFTYAHLNAHQEAAWLESTNYGLAPLVDGHGFSAITRMYRERHGVALDPRDWPATLIRAAIPYAGRRVVVVVPDSYQIPRSARDEARARGVILAVVPLSSLSGEAVRRVVRQFVVRPSDRYGVMYPEALERKLGESMWNDFLHLPPHLRPGVAEAV